MPSMVAESGRRGLRSGQYPSRVPRSSVMHQVEFSDYRSKRTIFRYPMKNEAMKPVFNQRPE